MNTIPQPYLDAMMSDEVKLAPLLGWYDLMPPRESTGTIWARNGKEAWPGSGVTDLPLPKWRRDWGAAGQLIARCHLSVLPSTGHVTVYAGDARDVHATEMYTDHPTKDDAIRAAMVACSLQWLAAGGKAL